MDATVFRVLGSPRRREILRLTWQDEVAAGDIHGAMPDVTFGAVSLHLRALVDAGLIDVRTDGRHRLYRARREALVDVAPMLEAMWNDALWTLKLSAELEHSRRGPRRGRRRAPRRKGSRS